MLISAKNISRDQNRVVELPLSKSESNRALMIMHYYGIEELRNSGIKGDGNSMVPELVEGSSPSLRQAQQLNEVKDLVSRCLGVSVSLSNSDDTVLLQKHLNAINQYIKDCEQGLLSEVRSPLTLDCHNAGTVFRFLMTAVANLYLGVSVTRCLGVLLTGSERMKSRPIDSLVDALRSLGVSIEYQGREGYPPILISSTNLANQHESSSPNNTCDSRDPWMSNTSSSNTRDPRDTWRSNPCDTWRLEISAEQSSQFASSLLLAAPLWKNGLELHLTGILSSLPYIDMTIDMMRQCGIDVVRNDRDIMVKPGCYNVENIKVEPDWSAAAFWYEIASFSDNAEILLKNLNINSLQADAAAIKMFQCLGVETLPVKEGVLLKKVNSQRSTVSGNSSVGCQLKVQSSELKVQSSELKVQSSTFNFKDCPDLFPAVIAACAGNKVNATFTGLKNLSIKESDRKHAMMNELSKINIAFEDVSDDELKMFCPEELPYFTEESPIVFDNYEDHRIAMALSVLSMKIGTVSMENTEVVSKSYPGFFESM
ncbi:MAG: hypothetical protein IKV80_05925 [Bacteroidales bacterium]|nr:hypothetical protein [Bacteroidales bacterium]